MCACPRCSGVVALRVGYETGRHCVSAFCMGYVASRLSVVALGMRQISGCKAAIAICEGSGRGSPILLTNRKGACSNWNVHARRCCLSVANRDRSGEGLVPGGRLVPSRVENIVVERLHRIRSCCLSRGC